MMTQKYKARTFNKEALIVSKFWGKQASYRVSKSEIRLSLERTPSSMSALLLKADIGRTHWNVRVCARSGRKQIQQSVTYSVTYSTTSSAPVARTPGGAAPQEELHGVADLRLEPQVVSTTLQTDHCERSTVPRCQIAMRVTKTTKELR
jgi:hypothetical protein